MRPSDLPIRVRLVLLGVFTNVLLLVATGMGVYSTARLNERLETDLATQARIHDARDLARAAQLAPTPERLKILDAALGEIGVPRDAAMNPGELAQSLGRHAETQAELAVRDAQEEGRSSMVLLVSVAVIAVLASTIVGIGNAHTIVPPLGRAVGLARAVAAGDLTAQVTSSRRDELGQLLGAIRDMNASLSGIVHRVQSGAQSVMDASNRIADATTDLSSRTEQQATSLEETAASIEQMTATVDQNAGNSRTANERALHAAEAARRSGEVVQRVVEKMQGIQVRSRQISEIIVLIDSIAFQTNILALNAAVEAARAGESGKGFAVVAKEVRYLSQRTADSAGQIKDLIKGTVSEVDAGAALADEAGVAMAGVTASVGEVSSIISEIASATREQQLGITQINQAVGELERVTQQNASMVQNSAAAAESLRQMASQLERAVAFFNVGAGTALLVQG
jgi:methyl-accepting chemotaxis protein